MKPCNSGLDCSHNYNYDNDYDYDYENDYDNDGEGAHSAPAERLGWPGFLRHGSG
jgi:hypothetical protein